MATKRVLLGYQRKQERVITLLASKVEKLNFLRQTEDDRIRQEEEHLQSLKEQAEQLRRQVQDESHQHQSLASQVAYLRGTVSKLELDRGNLAKDVATAKKNQDEVVRSIQEFESKHAQVLQALEDQNTTKTTIVATMLAELKQASQSRESMEKDLHEALKRHESIRKAHGLSPDASNTTPGYESGFFQELLAKEKQATGVEESAKFDLIVRLLSNRNEMVHVDKQIHALEQDISQKNCRAEEQHSTLRALKNNNSRQEERLGLSQKRVQEWRAKYNAKLAEQKMMSTEAEKRALQARQQISEFERDLQSARIRCKEMRGSLDLLKAERKNFARVGNGNVETLESSIKGLTEKLNADLNECELSKDVCCKEEEKYKELTEKILAGKFSALAIIQIQ